ncbi:redoxin domain-containing protein [Flavitalea flava]
MNRILSFLLLTSYITTISFAPIQNGKFEIIGNLSGFKDSAYIGLYDFSTEENVFMDSAQVINGKFVFKGSINKDYQSVGLMIQGDLKVFWMESGVIHFNAKKGDFYSAVITGSSMQDESNRLASILRANPNQDEKENIAYIKSHPNSLISGSTLKVYCRKWGRDTTRLLYDGFSEKVKQSEFGKIIYQYLSLNKNIKVGDKFTDFTLPDINGKDVSLSDYRNKYVLLDFWGSWCRPCREENPALVKIYHEFKDKGFDILGVSGETDRKWWLDAVHRDNIPWENVSDLKGRYNKAALIYGIDYYPANFLIAPNGTIIGKDLRGDDLRDKLSVILPK